MPNFPLRFGRGAGLEASPAEHLQSGYRELQNVRVDHRDIVEKRPGAFEISRSDSADPNSQLSPDDLQALFYRDDELLLETGTSLYSRRKCVGAGAQSAGTATPTEIADTIAALDDKYQTVFEIQRPQTPLPNTSIALDRLDIKAESALPITLTDGAFSVDITVKAVAGVLEVSWTGDDTGFENLATDAWDFRFFQRTGTTARIVAARGPFSGSRSTLAVWLIAASESSGTVIRTFINSYNNVLGTPSAAAWGVTVQGVGFVQVAGSSYSIRDFDTGNSYSLSPAESALIDSSATNKFRAAYDDDQIGTNGPFFAVVPFASVVPGGSRCYLYDLPGAPGPAGSSVAVDIVDWTTGAELGLASTGTTPILAIKDMGANAFTVKTLVGFVQWNGPANGITSTFDNSSGTVVYRPAIDGVPLSAVDLGAGATLSTFHEWKAGGANAIVGANLKTLGGGAIWSQYLGDPAPTLRVTLASDVYSLAVAVSANWYAVLTRNATDHRIHYSADAGLWASNTTLTITAALDASVSGDNLSATLVDAGPSFRLRATQFSRADFVVVSYTYTHATLTISQLRKDALSSHPFGVEVAHLELGAFPRMLIAFRNYDDQKNTVVYELDAPDLWVRVAPPSVALPGGDWARRGPWSRARLRSPSLRDFEHTVEECSAARIVSSQDPDGRCVVALADVDLEGVYLIVYSEQPETVALVDGTGSDPHVARYSPTQALLSYVNASNEVVYQVLATGQSVAFAPVGMTLTAEHAHDCDAGATSEDSFAAWHGKTGVAAAELYVIPGPGSAYPPTSTIVSPTLWTNVQAVDLYAMVDTSTDIPKVVIAQAGEKDTTIWVRVAYLTADPPVSVQWEHEFDTGLSAATWSVRAVSAGAVLSTLENRIEIWLEVEDAQPERTVYAWRVDNPPVVTQIGKWRRTSIAGGMREVDQINPCLLGLLSATDAGGSRSSRSGYFLTCATSGEIVGRADFGTAEDATARILQRNQLSNLNWDGGSELIVGVRRFQAATKPTQAQFLSWDFTKRPNRPGVAASVLVSAHGGYPRAYDGSEVREFDWHELPQIVSVTPSALGGSLALGSYGVAITYEETDAVGQFYRSAPAFVNTTLTGGQNAIRLQVRPLVFTERPNPRLVVWRTLVNGGTYYKAAEVVAIQDLDKVQIDLLAADAALNNAEVLDQVLDGVLVSTPGPSTDFLVFADGRYWTLDPERPSLLRHSIPAAEGRAPHFNLGLGLETPNAQSATAIVEMDGRLVAFSTTSLYYTSTGGPDATGSGEYSPLVLIPSEIGATDISTTTLCPDGVFFGSTSGPRLLSRGLQIVAFGEPVARFFEVENTELNTAYWLPSEGSLRLGSINGRVLRYHSESRRWAEDTGRQSRDAAISRSGTYAVLAADGRVLVEDDPDLYTDGGLVYTSRVTTPWLRVPNESGLLHSKLTVHRAMFLGYRRGPHTVAATLSGNYGALDDIVWTLDQASIDAQPFYLVNLDGVRATGHTFALAFQDDAEPNATFALEAIDVEFSAEGDKSVPFAPTQNAKRTAT